TGHHWYYGFDNNHGSDVDLVTVLLHEFAHGLGFTTFTDEQTGALAQGFPSVFDKFLRDDSTGKVWSDMTTAERAASAINTGNLVWAGPQVVAGVPGLLTDGADSSNRVKMYTPNPFEGGSSVSHFDRTATPNLLMEPFISSSLTHSLADSNDLTFALLRD